MVLLSTRLDLYASDESRLIAKSRRLRDAAALLLAGTAAIVAGSTVESF
jgi:hypothetical protein